jgi:hypothetical protein
MLKPFALEIYRRYRAGETIEQLASDLGIPADRIEQRVRAAEAYLRRNSLVAA